METDAFGFESLNGEFRDLFHGKKNTDVELVKAFFFFLETYSAHASHTYKSQMLYSFCDQEANGYEETEYSNGVHIKSFFLFLK